MSTRGTDPLNITGDNTRIIQFSQTVINPQTSNQSNPYGNTIRVQFPYPQQFKNCSVALADLYIFYSWYNIQASFGNNVFTYSYPTSAGYTTYTVTIPDGFYTIDQLNSFFEEIQFNNGTYTYPTGMSNIMSNATFYIYWVTNATYYRTTLFANPVPVSGVSYGSAGAPYAAVDPYITFLDNGAGAGTSTPGRFSFSKTLGFTPGSYPTPGTTIPISLNGQYPPVIESTNAVNVACSMVNQGTISPFVNVFYSFSPSVAFGEEIIVSPPWARYCPVSDGFYNSIDITLYDDFLNPLNIQDPHITGSIIIKG